MRIYVASSWKNPHQPGVVAMLRNYGHEVYDFRHPVPGNDGFSWKQVGLERDGEGKSTIAQLSKAHAHATAEDGFRFDFDAMKRCNMCVLVLPCGNSAHLEAGYMAGQGKLVFVYAPPEQRVEPELMYKFLDRMFDDMGKLLAKLEKFGYDREAAPRSASAVASTTPIASHVHPSQWEIGDVARYTTGPTALMVLRSFHGEGKWKRWYGDQFFGGSVGAYEIDLQTITAADRELVESYPGPNQDGTLKADYERMAETIREMDKRKAGGF